MDGSLLIAMKHGIGLELDGGRGFADGDDAKVQQLRDRRRLLHVRDVAVDERAVQLALRVLQYRKLPSVLVLLVGRRGR